MDAQHKLAIEELMRRLANRAQNEEMIDQNFTEHGKDLCAANYALNYLIGLHEIATTLVLNAEEIPDPREDNETDCYAVSLDDVADLDEILRVLSE